MFGAPERRIGEDGPYFYVSLASPKLLGVRVTLTAARTVEPDLSFQDNFRELQDFVLSELLKNRQLFKNPPSLESLQAITPNWGCIVKDKDVVWNTYMQLSLPDLKAELLPAWGDFALVGLTVTRSTISPVFMMQFLETKASQIDFEWPGVPSGGGGGADSLEEVSDIAAAVAEGSVRLRNPADILKEKLEQKTVVRQAFEDAEAARLRAEQLANTFMAKYDLSDNESAFSEWMSGAESEDS